MIPITISLSPNTQLDDIWLAFKSIWQISKYSQGPDLKKVENLLSQQLKAKYVFLFLSGRTSLFFLLKNLGFEKNNEVLLQSFTCVAVPEAIISAGLKPIYIDTEKDGYNMDILKIEKHITQKTKAIIIQHTFGIPIDRHKIIELCRKYNLFLIEDSAHILDPTRMPPFKDNSYKNHAVIYSFGRDKAFSSVFGGAIATNNTKLAQKLKINYEKLEFPSKFFIASVLLHPILLNLLVLPLYNIFSCGKILLRILLYLRIIPRSVFKQEKIEAVIPIFLLKKYPNVLARLALNQLKKIDIYNNHRLKLTKLYLKNLKNIPDIILPKLSQETPLLRFPFLTSRRKLIHKVCRQNNIYLADWYEEAVAPSGVNFKAINYQIGSCPNTEKIARQVVNLPTHINISLEKAKLLTQIIKNCLSSPHNYTT